MITLDDAVQMMDACSIVMSRNTQTAWNIVKTQLSDITAERDRLAGELAELKKKIDESPELKIFQAADMWSIKLDELSMLFGFGMYKDMKPGETRRFKLVEWKEGAE